MDKTICHTHKVFDYEWEDCTEVEVEEPEEKGMFFGWLVCALASNAFTYGCSYDWFADKCTCKGEPVNPIWRGR